jgi:hypothetical protein
MAAYGDDTATASGYVAAAAALVRSVPGHEQWTERQVVAQLAGTIHPLSSATHSDQLGYGVIEPAQAVSGDPVDIGALPNFNVLFPDTSTTPPGAGGPSGGGPSTSSAPSTAITATTTSGSHGVNTLLLFSFALIAAAVGVLFWKRRQRPEPVPVKPREEWGPPEGPRHSGYGPPPE